jgi:hypothetical protein
VSSPSYAKALDALLIPLGFQREGRDWNRRTDKVLDCVNLQTSQIAGATVNICTKDLVSEALLAEALGADTPRMNYHSIARIGSLIDGVDIWWRRDPNGPAEMAERVKAYGLPSFDNMHRLEFQARRFGRASTAPKIHAPSALQLAVTLYRMGEREEACQFLAKPPDNYTDPFWRAQLVKMRGWLGCPEAEALASRL